MSTSRLIFFPASTDDTFGSQSTLETLINSQFIISEAHDTHHYLPGDRFLNLITFLGCSPNINLFPVDGESHCFISLIEHTDSAHCVGFTKTAKPKCPNCTKRIADWKISGWQLPGKLCNCDKCQLQTPYSQLNWKHECGFARCGFMVNHIYPHEAVPTDQLMDLLKQASGFKWDYSYANN